MRYQVESLRLQSRADEAKLRLPALWRQNPKMRGFNKANQVRDKIDSVLS